MAVWDEERVARALITRLAEPGDRFMGALLAERGPAGVIATIRGQLGPPEEVGPRGGGQRVSPAGEVMRRVEDRLAGWRMRLADADPEVDLTVCERLGGRLICPGDPEWPSQLDALGPKAPYGLWLRGPVDLRYRCLRSVAVVGARAATDYGCRTASDLGAELVDRGWSVVSGGALGIDAAAHRGSLAADGPTMAVLANGVDVAYPPRNEALLAEIGQRGLLISEWPPGFHPTRGRFLIRNRVIAALTLGTVVVEADLRSGSLNTARYAEELNRPVLAVPGPVTSLMSRGCHAWIRDGRATCVSSALEIIESLGRMGEDLAPVRRGPVLPRDRLDPEACRILDAFPSTGNVGIAQIAVRAGVDITTTQNRLSLLAAAGFIERRGQNWRLPRSTPNPRSDNGLVG